MIPLQRLAFEQDGNKDCEDGQGYCFLDDLKLHNVERPAVFVEAYPVCRHLGAVLEESQAPRKQDDEKYWPTGGNFHFLQLKMSVPGECHKDI